MLSTLERIERGGERIVASLPGMSQWQRERRAAREARAEGGTALFAVALDSPEGDIQASHQRSAWTAQIKLIEQAETRTRSQELLLRQLRRNVRDLDEAEARRHPTPENMAGRRLADFGPVGGAASGLIGMFGGVRLWMVLAGGMALTTGAAAIQTARLDHAKHDLTDARDTAIHNAEAAAQWQQRANAYATALGDAQHAAQTTAHTLESERAAVARARRREQQRVHDIQSVLTNGEPPAWRLRDDPPADLSAPAPIPAPTGNPG